MKAKTTITEALAELKTLDKRIESTRDFILRYGIRQGSTIDPLADEGGSDAEIPRRMQSLSDLLQRKVDIRTAINAVNATTTLEVAGIKRTVAEWIVWRREAFKQELDAYQRLQQQITAARKDCANKNLTIREDGQQPTKVTEVSCFIKEGQIQKNIERLTTIESTLDGQLSRINATTTVEI